MRFISTEHVYEVRYLIAAKDGYTNYICVENEKTYIVSYVEKEEYIRNLCPLFLNYRDMASFDDLIEVFMYEEGLAIVFSHYTVVDRTKPEKFEDKILFLEHFLSALCVSSVPPNIAYDILKNSNAGICADGNFHFYYNLTELSDYEVDPLSESRKFCRELSGYAKELFKAEYKKKQYGGLKNFFEQLSEASYENMLGLFDAYMDVIAEYKSYTADGKASIKKKNHSFGDFIGKSIHLLKKAVVLVIIIAAVGMLLYSIFFCPEDGGTGGKYEYIGELRIKEFQIEEFQEGK